MWLFMSAEQPGVNAVIARLADAKINLAAYGITLSIALIIESPIIQMLSAATALSDGRYNYRMLLKFMHILAGSLTLVHIVLAFSPLYTLLLEKVLKLPHEVIEPARSSFIIMIPWAGTIGYRRLFQGVLIRYGKTREISYTMFLRLLFTLGSLALGALYTDLGGADLGAFALIMGVTGGMIVSFLYALPVIRRLEPEPVSKRLSWKYLVTFYYPLLLTSLITFLARPILSFGIARAAFPLESLAVWPVVLSVMFLFRALALSYQEVVVALLKDVGNIIELRTFVRRLSAAVGIFFFLFSFSPLGELWYRNIAGLDLELMGFTRLPSLIVVLVPVLGAFLSFYRGILIYAGRTKYIAQAVFLNTAGLSLMVIFLPSLLPLSGVIVAALSFSVSQILEVVYLWYRAGQVV